MARLAIIPGLLLVASASAAAAPLESSETVTVENLTAELSPSGALTLRGADVVTVELDPNATETVYHHIPSIGGDDREDLVRWLSTTFYEEVGYGPTPAYILYSPDITRADILSYPLNPWAAGYPDIAPETENDRQTAERRWSVAQTNARTPGEQLCAYNDGHGYLEGVMAEECYISCTGYALIATDLATVASRAVLIHADVKTFSDGTRFAISEGHSTAEFMGEDGHWFVIDPTFGFEYVTNGDHRLNVEELIDALAEGHAADLTFAISYEGGMKAVPGDVVLENEPTLATIYYTPDKRPEYLPRNGDAG